MELLIILAGPAIIASGLYAKDLFVVVVGALYTAVFAVAYFLRLYNNKRAQRELRRKQSQLIEQWAEQQEVQNNKHIDR